MTAASLDDLRPLLDRIRARSVERDRDRELPYDDIAELARTGFGALRVPVPHGGAGLTVTEATERLLALAAADSNIVQALRSHFSYTEALLVSHDGPARDRWLAEVGRGGLIGGGATERTPGNSDRFGTTVTLRDDGTQVLDGRKFYSTGSLYADWFVTYAEAEDGSLAQVVVRTDADGVTMLDDWDGFGQQLTASGSTVLAGVEVDEADRFPEGEHAGAFAFMFGQQFHLIALAGIARAVHDEVVGYVGERRRYFAHGPRVLPREDPLVQAVVGEISAAAYLSETLVRQTAGELEVLERAILADTVTPADLDRAELQIYRAQHLIVEAVLRATSRVFEVGGASALSKDLGWDRHWRNARTVASHNPVAYRLTAIADFELNGVSPFRSWFSGVDLKDRFSPQAEA